jgi:DNA mismatch endonuclease (patch repair protein)
MSRVRGRGNLATELVVVGLLRKHRIRGWRRNTSIFGKPDFVFPKERLAVFVDGCFWHCCPKHKSQPVANRLFWRTKLAKNRARDIRVTRTLRKMGWTVLRIWQHECRTSNLPDLAAKLRAAVQKASAP